jgi:alpha-beta hydrolase superfamily lysophospholipase
METTEWEWKTKDGIEIYSKAWIPGQQARGVVVLVHGVGEHVGRYERVAQAMTTAGYVMAGFDLRGFGKSGGPKGHTPSLDTYFDDIDLFLGELNRKYPGLPKFLYGHSLGAMLVMAYTPLRKPNVVGVIATSPGTKTALQEQKFKVLLAKILGKALPTFTLVSGVDPQALSRDPQVAIDYVNDPLVHAKITTGWGLHVLKLIDLIDENASRFPRPLLLMHGTADALNYPVSSTSFAEAAPKDKVTLKMWDGLKHELHNETIKDEVFKTMVDWMEALL